MSAPPRRATPPTFTSFVVLVLTLPLLVWVVQWNVGGWIPQGDEAIVALKAQDVFTSHPPLLGMRSTSSASVAGADAHHPGPIQFYLLAFPYLLFQYHALGLLVGSALVDAAFIAVSIRQAWFVARRRGVAAVAVAVAGVEFVVGSAVVLPWNIYPPMFGLIAVLVTSWRLIRGGSGALPWWVGSTSLVLQANLFYLPTLAPLLVLLLVVGLVRWHRWRGAWWPMPGDGTPYSDRPAWKRPGWVAVAVAVVCWTPSMVELLLLHPNNAEEVGALIEGTLSRQPLPVTVVVVLAGIGAVYGVWHWASTARRPSVWLSAVVSVVSVLLGLWAALLAGGPSRAYYAVMAAPLPFLLVAVLALNRIPRLFLRSHSWPVPAALAGLLTLLAVVTGPGAWMPTAGTHDEWANAMAARRDVDAVVEQLDRQVYKHPPVEVLGGGFRTSLSSESALMVALRHRGCAVYAPRPWPHREDDEQRDASSMPSQHLTIELFDDKPPRIIAPWEWPAVKP